MKSAELAAMLRAIPARWVVAGTNDLAAALEQSPSATVSAATRRLAVDGSASFWTHRTDVAAALIALRPLLATVAKATLVKDVDALLAMLERGPGGAVAPTRRARSAGKATGDPEVVGSYTRELAATLGDERRFAEVFDRLKADPSLSTSDFRAVAREFAKASPRSKADALKKIWARQQSLLGFEAKARATDGRSAA